MNQSIKDAFIRLSMECKALTFGEFTLKSGRISPYFFNAGLFYHGNSLRKIGQFYAKTLLSNKIGFQHLFGPAYKGIPLATSTAIALAEEDVHVTVTFNRKEVKTHGEGGQLIGAPLQGDTVIVDDVITAGTAFREAQTLIREHGGKLTAVIIALDWCERGLGNESTLSEIESKGIQVFSIITLFDLIDYFKREGATQRVQLLLDYLEQYGWSN